MKKNTSNRLSSDGRIYKSTIIQTLQGTGIIIIM